MQSHSQRLIELDLLRGLAIIGMIIFHVFFILDFLEISNHQMNEGTWHLLARTTQILFLTLVGISLTLSKRDTIHQIKRGAKVLSYGILISIITFFTTPSFYVKFGILHLIGISIILISPLRKKKLSPLILGALILALTPLITEIKTSFSPAYILGLTINNSQAALDYFPIFPWISFPLIGITIGNILYKSKKKHSLIPRIKNKLLKKLITPITLAGKHSLIIYLIHIPIIIATLLILQITSFAILLNQQIL